MEQKNDKKIKWYDNGGFITSFIIVAIAAIILCSQSFANNGASSLTLFTSIINHNSFYLLMLVYFIFLKLPFGKKYFNYLNIFLVLVFTISTITSFLTLIQSVSLNTILDFILNMLFFIYLIHTLFRDTWVWEEYHFSKSPFNELSNEWSYYSILVVCVLLLTVNLISTVAMSGVVISILDTIFYVLFGRYVYLYREYLDKKKINSDNPGNFDGVRDKVQEVLDKTEIDDKIVNAVKEVKEKVEDLVDNNTEKEKVEADDTVKSEETTTKVEEVKEVKKKTTRKKKSDTKEGDK